MHIKYLQTVLSNCHGDWKDSPVIKNTGCSHREPRFASQNQYGGLQSSITLVPGDLRLSLASKGIRNTCAYKHTSKPLIPMKKKSFLKNCNAKPGSSWECRPHFTPPLTCRQGHLYHKDLINFIFQKSTSFPSFQLQLHITSSAHHPLISPSTLYRITLALTHLLIVLPSPVIISLQTSHQ